MAKLAPFGKAKKDRLRGGEVWSVIMITPGKETALKLRLGDRMRLEDRPNSKGNTNLYPEGNTKWFTLGNESIKLKQLRDHAVKGKLYEFKIDTGGGAKKELWLEEGGTNDVELRLHESNPDETGGVGNGAAGYRR